MDKSETINLETEDDKRVNHKRKMWGDQRSVTKGKKKEEMRERKRKRKDMNQIYVNAMRVPKIVRSPFYNNCATLSDDNTLNPSSIMYVRSLVTLNQGLRQNRKTNKKRTGNRFQ